MYRLTDAFFSRRDPARPSWRCFWKILDEIRCDVQQCRREARALILESLNSTFKPRWTFQGSDG
jgi:hypothetical protein